VKTSDPNIAIPTMKPIALQVAKTRLANSAIGMIGSLARCSTSTNTTASAGPPSSSVSAVADAHPYASPAQVVYSRTAVTAATTTAAPA